MDKNHHADFCIDRNCAEDALPVATPFMHPDHVMSNLQLTPAQKREILASWASDARAVHDMPALRQLDNGAIVRVDDVLRALRSLDDNVTFGQHAFSRACPPAQRRRSAAWPKTAVWRKRSTDDDDDPPPCPAIIAGPPRGPLSGSEMVDVAA